KKGGFNMLTEDKIKEVIGGLEEPFIHKTLAELDAIQEIKIKAEKNHVSVKIAVAKTGTAEQLQLQTEVVNLLKEAGAATVGIRFTELPEEVLSQYQTESAGGEEGLLSQNNSTTFIAIASGK